MAQYITTCKLIGGVDMDSSDKQLLEMLTKPENIKIVFEIERQSILIKRQILREFGENIQKTLQNKIKSANLENIWKSSFSFDDRVGRLHVDIKTLKHQIKPNYRMFAEYLFHPQINTGWSGWFRPQKIDLKKNQPDMDTKILTAKMIANGCYDAQDEWVGWKDLRDGKKGFSFTNMDDLIACLEDNGTENHPLADSIAAELWDMFIAYREDIEALDGFKQAAS
jgi:hypothetical protein